jgi:hypothetical protein
MRFSGRGYATDIVDTVETALSRVSLISLLSGSERPAREIFCPPEFRFWGLCRGAIIQHILMTKSSSKYARSFLAVLCLFWVVNLVDFKGYAPDDFLIQRGFPVHWMMEGWFLHIHRILWFGAVADFVIVFAVAVLLGWTWTRFSVK